MSTTNTIREAKAYRARLITRLEMKGLSNLEDQTLDDLEVFEVEPGTTKPGGK